MRSRLLDAPLVFLFVALALVGGCRRRHAHLTAPSHAAPIAPTRFDVAAIDAWLAAEVEEKHWPGLGVALVRNGEVVLAKGYGKRNLESGAPVETDTAFAIGSVTKQLTCASVLLLAEEGKLSVDDPVGKYYPALTRADDITLYDVLTHTAGYPDYYPLDFLDRRMVAPIDPDALLARYAGGALDFEPRTRWSYSNTGFVLAGRIVEKVSGAPLDELLRTRIFEPNGMTHSALSPKDDVPWIARGYRTFALGPMQPAPREASGWLGGAGGVYASPSDLARWDLALVDGKVLNAQSFARMTTPRVLPNGKGHDYGCGIGVRRRYYQTVLQHSGAVSGFVAANAVVPAARSAVVLMVNAETPDLGEVHEKILGLLLQSIAEEDVPKVAGPPPKEVALRMLHEMQSGTIDRSALGEELSVFMSDEKLKESAPRLRALGEPTRVDVLSLSERGGMEVAWIKMVFATTEVVAPLYRTPDGKVQEFLPMR